MVPSLYHASLEITPELLNRRSVSRLGQQKLLLASDPAGICLVPSKKPSQKGQGCLKDGDFKARDSRSRVSGQGSTGRLPCLVPFWVCYGFLVRDHINHRRPRKELHGSVQEQLLSVGHGV